MSTIVLLMVGCPVLVRAEGQWIIPKDTSGPLTWGHRDGIVFGIPSPGGMRGPRGLIRVGLPDKQGSHTLINFIAIEPVTVGVGHRFSRMAFSELEHSELDDKRPGKKLWVDDAGGQLSPVAEAATSGVERLRVRIMVEKFWSNRAHVYVDASIRSDRPDELELAVGHHPDSALIDELTVTATMGNYMRGRRLWLADRIIDSRELYSDFQGVDFVEKESYPLDQMLRWQNDPVALLTTDESDPGAVYVWGNRGWTYKGPKLTQYWRVSEEDVQPDLRVRVNGRRVYWMSKTEIPGGISFENFELRQKYQPGQVFVFGLTRRAPDDLTPSIVRLPSLPD